MANKEAFHTRTRANEGIRLDLKINGVVEGWLDIRGRYSDAYRAAKTAHERRKWLEIEIPKNDEATKARLNVENDTALTASLVAEWSFDEPCTHEAVVEWLLECPQVADEIDFEAATNEYFLGKRSSNSPVGPSENSNF